MTGRDPRPEKVRDYRRRSYAGRANYDQPMPVGDRLVVRIRRVRLGELGGAAWIGFRLTHPHGRRPVDGTADFPIVGAAERFARDRGWTVLGGSR